jgi:hypothetical protein
MADNVSPIENPSLFQEDMKIHDRFKWPTREQWDAMSLEKKKEVMEAYRFSGLRPGTYQGVTFASDNGQIPF